jgi:release factor glutamine methyltransferase
MFVKENSLHAVLEYFKLGLESLYTEREVRKISRAIICQRMQWTEMDFILNANATFSESDLLFFRSKLKALQKNEPFQYVIGSTYFYNVELKTDERALIPRPETEELVHLILEQNNQAEKTLLDIGTGSGCIPLAIKKARPNWKVEGLDVDDNTLSLAIENKALNQLDVDFIRWDILNEILFDTYPHPLDIIVSNPPYIPLQERQKMDKNVTEFEPEKALFVDDHDALLFYKKIVKFAKINLSKKGLLYLEIHEDLGSDVFDLLKNNGWYNIVVHKDLQGKERMVTASISA